MTNYSTPAEQAAIENIAAIVTLVVQRDKLYAALLMQATNFDRLHRDAPCWCKDLEKTIDMKCKNQRQCIQAKIAIERLRE